MNRYRGVLAALGIALVIVGTVKADTLLDEKYPRRDRIQVVGFELTKPGEITINATGLGVEHNDDMFAYAWIIDHDTRKLVWEMKAEGSDRAWGKKYIRKTSVDQVFSRGKYELYLYTGDGDFYYSNGDGSVLNVINGIFSTNGKRLNDQLEDCSVVLESKELTTADIKKFEPTGALDGSLFAATELGDDDYIEQAFTLDKPMSTRIYMLMEAPQGWENPVDFGWIINADTHEKVWSAEDARSARAGGGKKNRKVDAEVPLAAGNYILYYVTDDSHSYKRFNAAPPYDPMNWGVTLLPGKDFDKAAFHLTKTPEGPDALVDLTMAGDDESLEASFTLAHDATLHVRAEGEWNDGEDDFADYGWIENNANGRTVWEMTDRNTDYAGGAEKNRIFDGEVKLPAGDYIAHFETDGSHSYDNWNSGQPWMPRAWGLAIFPGKGLNPSDFKLTTTNTSGKSRHHSRSWANSHRSGNR